MFARFTDAGRPDDEAEMTTGHRFTDVFVFVAATALLAGVTATPVVAQEVTESLLHQGRLIEDGEPVEGSLELTYTIYNQATDGEILWQDVVDAEASERGTYSVELGGPSNPIDATVLQDGEAWLGVAVDGGDELEPRLALHSVPFAVLAGEAVSVRPGAIGIDALDDEFLLPADYIEEVGWETLSDVPDEIWTDTLTELDCTQDQLARFDGTTWSCYSAPISTEADVLATTGDTLGGLSCTDGQLPYYSGGWQCGDVETGITDVQAGSGIQIGGTPEVPEISADFGTAAGTVTEGNDPRLSDARPPEPGSENYVQANVSSPQDVDFHVGGSGAVDDRLEVGELRDISTNFDLETWGGYTNTTSGEIAFGPYSASSGNSHYIEKIHFSGYHPHRSAYLRNPSTGEAYTGRFGCSNWGSDGGQRGDNCSYEFAYPIEINSSELWEVVIDDYSDGSNRRYSAVAYGYVAPSGRFARRGWSIGGQINCGGSTWCTVDTFEVPADQTLSLTGMGFSTRHTYSILRVETAAGDVLVPGHVLGPHEWGHMNTEFGRALTVDAGTEVRVRVYNDDSSIRAVSAHLEGFLQ